MTSTPRRTLADAVRRPAPAALIEGVPDRSPTSLAAAPALAPETFDPVRAIATLQGWLAHHKRSTAPGRDRGEHPAHGLGPHGACAVPDDA